jgi:hypothetical protein
MTRCHSLKDHGTKPIRLKKRLPSGSIHEKVGALISEAKIHTVCQKAHCPSMWECFSRKTATFMIMGDRCTRNCRFCAVAHGPRRPPDPVEPLRVAETVRRLKLDLLKQPAVLLSGVLIMLKSFTRLLYLFQINRIRMVSWLDNYGVGITFMQTMRPNLTIHQRFSKITEFQRSLKSC